MGFSAIVSTFKLQPNLTCTKQSEKVKQGCKNEQRSKNIKHKTQQNFKDKKKAATVLEVVNNAQCIT